MSARNEIAEAKQGIEVPSSDKAVRRFELNVLQDYMDDIENVIPLKLDVFAGEDEFLLPSVGRALQVGAGTIGIESSTMPNLIEVRIK